MFSLHDEEDSMEEDATSIENSSQIDGEDMAKKKEPDKQSSLWRFRNQTMKGYLPIPDYSNHLIMLLIFGIGFILFGAAYLYFLGNLAEFKVRYDNKTNCVLGGLCKIKIDLPETIEPPVFIHYEIHNMYQNHKLYVSSRNFEQLQGKDVPIDTLSKTCSPIVLQADTGQTTSWDGVPIGASQPANPCGLIARSAFTDSYELRMWTNIQIPINKSHTAWEWDGDLIKPNPESATKQYLNVDLDSFRVWMRPAFLSTFRKLYGRVQERLQKGEYYVNINNQFDVTLFNGEKWIVFSTANLLGGKNVRMAKLYIIIGILCLLVSGLLAKKRRQIQIKYGVEVEIKPRK